MVLIIVIKNMLNDEDSSKLVRMLTQSLQNKIYYITTNIKKWTNTFLEYDF